MTQPRRFMRGILHLVYVPPAMRFGRVVSFVMALGGCGSSDPGGLSLDALGMDGALIDAGGDASTPTVDCVDAGPNTAPPAPGCSPDNWCWSNPLGQGNYFHGVWGTSATNVWVVGASGMILHWNGTGWAEVDSGTTGDLRSISGTSVSDAWAVG